MQIYNSNIEEYIGYYCFDSEEEEEEEMVDFDEDGITEISNLDQPTIKLFSKNEHIDEDYYEQDDVIQSINNTIHR